MSFLPGQTLRIQVKKAFPTHNTLPKFADPGVLVGARYYTHADGPFEVPAEKAQQLIEQGLADVFVEAPAALNKPQRAVDPKLESARR